MRVYKRHRQVHRRARGAHRTHDVVLPVPAAGERAAALAVTAAGKGAANPVTAAGERAAAAVAAAGKGAALVCAREDLPQEQWPQ